MFNAYAYIYIYIYKGTHALTPIAA